MLLLMNSDGLKLSKIDPGFEIVGYADAEVEPSDFNMAPNLAIQKAL